MDDSTRSEFKKLYALLKCKQNKIGIVCGDTCDADLFLNQCGEWVEAGGSSFTCEDVNTCLGISGGGSASLFLNEQGDFLSISANPSDPDMSIQYNNAGAFYGDTGFTRDPVSFTTLIDGSNTGLISIGDITNTSTRLLVNSNIGFTSKTDLFSDYFYISDVNGFLKFASEPNGYTYIGDSNVGQTLVIVDPNTDLITLSTPGNIKLDIPTKGAGKILTSDVDGVATWENQLTASNGLTITSGDVQLGGTLTAPIVLDLDGNTFGFQDGGTGITFGADPGTSSILIEVDTQTISLGLESTRLSALDTISGESYGINAINSDGVTPIKDVRVFARVGDDINDGNYLRVSLTDGFGFFKDLVPFVTIGNTGIFTTASGQVVKTRVVTAAGAITVATTDYVVVANKTVGASTSVNLPAGVLGQVFIIKDGKGDALANNLTITPAAGTIDGAATSVINVNYASVTLVYNGTEWNVV